MTTSLVCAHRTLTSPELLDAMYLRAELDAAVFHLVVSVPHAGGGPGWSEGQLRFDTYRVLDDALHRFRAEGFRVDGEIGDPDPAEAVLAVLDAHPHGSFAEVIVSTLPLRLSRWLRLDVITRIRRATDLPVEHVVATRVPEPA